MVAIVPPPFAAIILAAGASLRMGRPKLLLPWNGASIIGHLISQWQKLGATQIGIVHRPNDGALLEELAQIAKEFNDSTIQRIPNPQPEQGMFGSILCAADWNGWKNEIQSFAIVLGDQPHLKMETLRQLLEFRGVNSNSICQPAFNGEPKHPVLLPRDIFFGLKNSGAATLKDFLKLHSRRSVQLTINDNGLLLDLDTPEDYKRALSLDA